MMLHLQIYLVDLEPFGDTSCVVVMPARQRYHGLTASESGQADRAAASTQTPENIISDAMEISLFVVNIRRKNNSHVVIAHMNRYLWPEIFVYFIYYS